MLHESLYNILFILLLLVVYTLIGQKRSFLSLIIVMELVVLTIIYVLIINTKNGFLYNPQMEVYCVFVVTFAAIESAIIITLLVTYYRLAGSVNLKTLHIT